MRRGVILLAGLLLASCGWWSRRAQEPSADEFAQPSVSSFDPLCAQTELPEQEDFVNITDIVPDAILEIRYHSTYNFVGARIDGYIEPTALLTHRAADSLKRVSDDLLAMGYRLKIYDAYRPQRAVSHFVRWARDIGDTLMKRYFYPDLDKRVLFAQGYIASHSGHSRGSTVDLTLFDMASEKDVDMGGTFDWFGPESHPSFCGDPYSMTYSGPYKGASASGQSASSCAGQGASADPHAACACQGASADPHAACACQQAPAGKPGSRSITPEQFANRMLLRRVMLAHGFKPLSTEWWHFTLAAEPHPDTYFDFPVQRLAPAE